jgi:hypothetical protein
MRNPKRNVVQLEILISVASPFLRAISRRGEVRLEVRNPRQTSRRRVSRRGQWPRLSEREHEPSPVRDALNGVDPDGAI